MRRVLGKEILPIKQELIDVQAQVVATHCPLLGYSCRGYLASISAAAPYTFRELLHLKGTYFSPACYSSVAASVPAPHQSSSPCMYAHARRPASHLQHLLLCDVT